MATSTGCYLLAVVAEPVSDDEKKIILERLNKGFLSWDVSSTGCDLQGLESICASVSEKDLQESDVLVQYSTESLGVEVLVNPPVSTLKQCLRNLLTSTIGHKHIIHAGYTFTGTGSWILQNGAFSYDDFLSVFKDAKSVSHRGSTIHIHCVEEGDWKTSNFTKEVFTKIANVSLNPPDKNTHLPGSEHLVNCLESMLTTHPLTEMMEASPLVGNIRFNRPTLYLFPAGEGDCALFGINGFNMLIDGGFNRKPCAWEFIRHLDRLDTVLVTQLSESNLCSMSTLMERKILNNTYPQIGYVFCNIAGGKIPSPVRENQRDKNDLLVSVVGEGHRFIQTLNDLKLVPHQCWRDSVLEPFVLYHKVGHGTLEMHILSPPKDSKEMVDFLSEWSAYKEKFSSVKFKGQMAPIPLTHATSVCAILVWRPNDPKDTITRILFPGSAPQSKIFEGLDKLKSLDILKHPTVTKASLSPLVLTKPKSKPVVSKAAVPNRKNTASPALSVNSVASRNGDIGNVKKDSLLVKDTINVKKTIKDSKKELKPKKEASEIKKDAKKETNEIKKDVKKETNEIKKEVKKDVKKDIKKELKPAAEKAAVTKTVSKKVDAAKTSETKKTSSVKKVAPKKELSTKAPAPKTAEKPDAKKIAKTESKTTKDSTSKKASEGKTTAKPKTKPTHTTTKPAAAKSKPTPVPKSPSKLTRAIAASAAVATAAVTVGVAELIGSKQEELEKDEILKIEVDEHEIKLPEPMQNGVEEELEEHIEIPLSPARLDAASPALSEPVSLTASDTLSSAPMETVSPTPPIHDLISPAEEKDVHEIDQQTPTDYESKHLPQENNVSDHEEPAERVLTPAYGDDLENVDEGIVEDNIEDKIDADRGVDIEESTNEVKVVMDTDDRMSTDGAPEVVEEEFIRANVTTTEAYSNFENEILNKEHEIQESVQHIDDTSGVSGQYEAEVADDVIGTKEELDMIPTEYGSETVIGHEQNYLGETENTYDKYPEEYAAEATDEQCFSKDSELYEKLDIKESEVDDQESHDQESHDQESHDQESHDQESHDQESHDQESDDHESEVENDKYEKEPVNEYSVDGKTISNNFEEIKKNHIETEDNVADIDDQLAKATMEDSFCAGYTPEDQDNVEYNVRDIPESMKTSIYEERDETDDVNDDYVQTIMSQYKENSENHLPNQESENDTVVQGYTMEIKHEEDDCTNAQHIEDINTVDAYEGHLGNDSETTVEPEQFKTERAADIPEPQFQQVDDQHDKYEAEVNKCIPDDYTNAGFQSFQAEREILPEAEPITSSINEPAVHYDENVEQHFDKYEEFCSEKEQKSQPLTEKQDLYEKDNDSAEDEDEDDGEMIIHPTPNDRTEQNLEFDMSDPIAQHYMNPSTYKTGNNNPLYEEQEYSGSERSSPVMEQPIFSNIDKPDFPELVTVSGGTTPSEPQSPKSPLDSKKGNIAALEVMEALSEHDCSESSNHSPLIRDVPHDFDEPLAYEDQTHEASHFDIQESEVKTAVSIEQEAYGSSESALNIEAPSTSEYEQSYEQEMYGSEFSEQVASGLHYETGVIASKPEFDEFDKFNVYADIKEPVLQNTTGESEFPETTETSDLHQGDYFSADEPLRNIPPGYENEEFEASTSAVESGYASVPIEFSVPPKNECVESEQLESYVDDHYHHDTSEQNRYSSASTVELDNFKNSTENFQNSEVLETIPVKSEIPFECEKSYDQSTVDCAEDCDNAIGDSGCPGTATKEYSQNKEIYDNDLYNKESFIENNKEDIPSMGVNGDRECFSDDRNNTESNGVLLLQGSESKSHDVEKPNFVPDSHYQSDSPESDNSMKHDTPEVLSQSDSENEPLGSYDVVNNKYLYNKQDYPYEVAAPPANEFDVVNKKFLYNEEYNSDNLNNVSGVPLQQKLKFDPTGERYGEASDEESQPNPGNVSPYAYTNEAYNQEDDADGNHIYKPPSTDGTETIPAGSNTHSNFQDNNYESHQVVSGMTYSPGFPDMHAADPGYDFRLEEWGKPMGLPTPSETTTKTAKKVTKATTKTTTKLADKKSMDNGKTPGLAKLTSSPIKKAKEQETESKPVYVDLAYVPHHGDPNYSDVEFFRRIRARYYVFSGISPSKEVLNALLEAKKSWNENLEVTIIPTYETDTLGYWLAQNQDTLAAHSIEVAPSASRCTVNLQDHETSCAAYRLEF